MITSTSAARGGQWAVLTARGASPRSMAPHATPPRGPQALPGSTATTQQLRAAWPARTTPQERKELIAGGFRDKHTVWGSMLLGAGVTFTVSGAVNTWMRTGGPPPQEG
jgi:hypothetical protein